MTLRITMCLLHIYEPKNRAKIQGTRYIWHEINYRERQADNIGCFKGKNVPNKSKKDEKKRDRETGKVVVEGVMIGQVPTTRRDNERKKASRELVAFPETPTSLSSHEMRTHRQTIVFAPFSRSWTVGIATINSRRMETSGERKPSVAPQSSFAFSTVCLNTPSFSCKMYTLPQRC